MVKDFVYTCVLIFFLLLLSAVAFSADMQIGTLSDGACWYEFKETLRVASFNDKNIYSENIEQIEFEIEKLIGTSISKDDIQKIQGIDLSLHCGGLGASLIAKVHTDSKNFCLWTKFDHGKLSLRSIGLMNNGEQNIRGKKGNELCDGYKWGELIIGLQGTSSIIELQSSQWSSMIREVVKVSENVVKVFLMKEYEFREQIVIDQLQKKLGGNNVIRYIEFNDYRHPIGEFVDLYR